MKCRMYTVGKITLFSGLIAFPKPHNCSKNADVLLVVSNSHFTSHPWNKNGSLLGNGLDLKAYMLNFPPSHSKLRCDLCPRHASTGPDNR